MQDRVLQDALFPAIYPLLLQNTLYAEYPTIKKIVNKQLKVRFFAEYRGRH